MTQEQILTQCHDGLYYRIPVYPTLYPRFLENAHPAISFLPTYINKDVGNHVLFIKTRNKTYASQIWNAIGHTKYMETMETLEH